MVLQFNVHYVLLSHDVYIIDAGNTFAVINNNYMNFVQQNIISGHVVGPDSLCKIDQMSMGNHLILHNEES